MLSFSRIIQIIIIICAFIYISKLDKQVETFSKTLGIIIPTRKISYIDRRYLKDLDYYLKNNYPYLQYKFIIVEHLNREYNKGALYNIGVKEFDCDYYAFQDFEVLPAGNANYIYPQRPQHLTDINSKCGDCIFTNGGVILSNKHDFLEMNGYSNKLHGLADADFINRINLKFPNIPRCENNVECSQVNKGRHIVNYEEQFRNLVKLPGYNPRKYMNDGFNKLKYKIVHRQSLTNFPKNCIILSVHIFPKKYTPKSDLL